jgi:hypothetical protein
MGGPLLGAALSTYPLLRSKPGPVMAHAVAPRQMFTTLAATNVVANVMAFATMMRSRKQRRTSSGEASRRASAQLLSSKLHLCRTGG